MTVFLLPLTVVLWVAGARVLGPRVRDYVGSRYNYGPTMLFRGGYQAVAAMLLSAGILSLMGLRWDLSLGKRGRRAAGILGGLLLAEAAYTVLAALYLGWVFGGGVLGPAVSPAVWLTMKESCIPLGLLCGAALFFAVDPSRKTG